KYSSDVTPEDGVYRVELKVIGIASETAEQFISKYPSNFIFVIDTSDSMKTQYNGKSRLDWATEMTKEIMTVFQKDSNVAIVGFSDSAVVKKALTPIRELKEEFPTLEYGGRTCIGCGLNKGIELLKNYKEKRPSYIILLTDGRNTGNIDPLEVAREGAIPIYAVSIGEKDQIDSDLLEKIADVTGGAYIHVSEIDKLKTEIQEKILKTKKISAQDLNIEYTPNYEVTVDLKTISVTSGNMETNINPVFKSEISPTGAELLKVFAPQLIPRDELLIKFNAIPKREVSNLGKVTLSAKDPKKEIKEEYDLKVTPKIKLEMNVDYPDTIYYAVAREVVVNLKNPSDTEVTIKPELQTLGDVKILKKPEETLKLGAQDSKTLTWELKSKEPKKDKAILQLKITGDNVILPEMPQKEVQVDEVYTQAKNAKYGMWGVYLGAILAAFGIGAVILYWRLRKKYKICKEIGRQELVNELKPSVMQINEPDYIKNEILSKMGIKPDTNEISEPDVRKEESKEEDTTTINKDYLKDMGNQ
ncbi:MAG: VWA domain-containing protein, partial [Methanosarcinales archaeon]